MATLPQVGAQAVILGMDAFNANANSVNRQLDNMSRSAYYLERTSRSAFDGVTSSGNVMFGALQVGAGIAIGSLVALVTATENVAQKYQAAVTYVTAITAAQSSEVAKLDAAQLQLSRHSTESATALALVSTQLVKNGISVQQATDSALKAANNIIILANGEIQAADASKLLATSMNTFGATAEQVADASAVAVNNSALSWSGLGDAINQSGALAAKQGLTFAQYAATLAVVGQNTDSASQAGIGLRTIFENLQNPSKKVAELLNDNKVSLYDATGAARPWRDILISLTNAFGPAAVASGKLTQEQRDQAVAALGGARGAEVLTAVLDGGVAAYDKYNKAAGTAGGAQESVNQILSSTPARVKQIQDNVEALAIAFGKGLDPFVNAVAGDMLRWLQSIDIEKVQKLGEAVGGDLYNAFANVGNYLNQQLTPNMTIFQAVAAATAIIVANNFAAMAASAIGSLIEFASALLGTGLTALTTFAATTGVALGPVILAIGAVAAAAALLTVAWRNDWLNIQEIVRAAADGIGSIINKVVNDLARAADAAEAWAKGVGAVPGPPQGEQRIGGQTDIEKGIQEEATVTAQKYAGVGNLIRNSVAAAGAALGRDIPAAANDAGAAINGFASTLTAGFEALKNFKPELHDFAADLQATAAATKAATDAVNAGRAIAPGGAGGGPSTSPGTYDDGSAGKAAKKAEEAFNNAVAKAHEIVKSFDKDLEKEVIGTVDAIDKAYVKAGQDMQKAADKAADDTTKAINDAQDKIDNLDSDRAIKDDQDKRKRALDDQLKEEAKHNKENLEDAEVTNQAKLDDAKLKYDEERKARERTFDQGQQDEAKIRQRGREDEDHTFQLSQEHQKTSLQEHQKDVEAQLQKEQQSRDEALRKQLDAETEELHKEQQAQSEALAKQTEAENEALRKKQQLETESFDDAREANKIAAKDTQDRADAQKTYTEELARGVKQSIAQQRLNDALAKIDKDRADAQAKLQGDVADRSAQDALKQKQEDEKLALETSQNDRALVLQKAQDDARLALEAAQNDKTLALRAELEQQTTDLHTAQENERVALDERLEADATKRKRDREDQDIKYQRGQEADKRKNTEKEDADELKNKQEVDAAERKRKRDLEEADTKFQEGQEQARDKLSKDFEDEDYRRRVDKINDERDKRIAEVNYTLGQEQEKTRNQLAQDIVDLNQHLADRITEIRTNYLDKLDDVVKEGGEKLQPLVDTILGSIDTQLGNIRDTAKEATDNLIAAFDAASNLQKAQDAANAAAAARASGPAGGVTPGNDGSTASGGRDWATYNFLRNSGKSDAEASKISDHQYGGVIPGPYGQPVLVQAHAGEVYEGIGGQGAALMAVRMAEAAWQRGIGAPSPVTNHYSYSVEASYGRVQPEGSISRDLSALVALTRR